MNKLKEIMNGKHEIKHLKIDNDTLSFNTELDNYDWNLTPRDIEMIIYTLQEDKNNLQSKIDKAIEYIEKDILNKKIEKVDWDFDDCYYSDMPVERIKPLIDILKGDK